MKYYSEYLKKFFDTEDDCQDAEDKAFEEERAKEAEVKKLSENRKNRAKEVEDSYKAYVAAQEEYYNRLAKFVKDYGSFHMTFSTDTRRAPETIRDAINHFLNS